MNTRYHRRLWFVFLSVWVFFPGIFSASAQTESQNVALEVRLTMNGLQRALSVSAGSPLELKWSAPEAKECKGDWVTYRLKNTGVQVGQLTKSRTFTIVCVGRNGSTGRATLSVKVAGKTKSAKSSLPVSGQKKVETTAVPYRTSVIPTSTPSSSSAVSAPVTEKLNLQVLSPHGEEVWNQGETRAIVWSTDSVPASRFDFTVDILGVHGESYALPTSTVPSFARSYIWRIPRTFPEGRYKARVRISNQASSAVSDSFFTVAKAYDVLRRPLACGSLGDANNDGIISTADAERITFFSSNPSTPTPDEFKRADVNTNGTLSSSDAVEVNQYLLESLKTFSGCGGVGVSADLRANGVSDAVSVPMHSTFTLSWTSNGGRCLMGDEVFPPRGSIVKSAAGNAPVTYVIQCFEAGSARSATDRVTVSVAPVNKGPLITLIDAPTYLRAGQNYRWSVTAFDPDGTALTFGMNFGDGTSSSTVASTTTIGGSIRATFSHLFVSAGTYKAVTTVKDSRGAEIFHPALLVVTEPSRTSLQTGAYQLGALFEGYRLPRLFHAVSR